MDSDLLRAILDAATTTEVPDEASLAVLADNLADASSEERLFVLRELLSAVTYLRSGVAALHRLHGKTLGLDREIPPTEHSSFNYEAREGEASRNRLLHEMGKQIETGHWYAIRFDAMQKIDYANLLRGGHTMRYELKMVSINGRMNRGGSHDSR